MLEGWCVGARSVDGAALAEPCNALEREGDPEGVWRRYANAQLATDYADLFAILDAFAYLRAPDLESIRRWRLEQEAERPAAQRMNAAAVDRFVEHYERITREMLATLPGRADWTIELAPDHSIAGIIRRGPQRAPSRA